MADGGDAGSSASHQLRAQIPNFTPIVESLAPRVAKQDNKVIEMHAQAATLGYACSSLDKLRKSLGASIASRMRPRQGKFIWQTATGSVENFPRSAALQLLPETMRTGSRENGCIWEVNLMEDLATIIGPLIAQSTSFSAGATKALFTDSERVVRVVATIIPTLKLLWKERQGIDCLYFEFQYVLADEDGEMHSPKDGNRIEKALGPELERSIREQILADVRVMADAGAPMGPGFLRQLGRLDEAAAVEACLHRMQETAPAPALTLNEKRKKRTRTSSLTWTVKNILDERPQTSTTEASFLVEWDGYHVSWERYRATGLPGQPVTTWEPLTFLINNEALHAWRQG